MGMAPSPWNIDVFGSTLAPRAATPSVIDPLPSEHRRGLIAVGVTALLSTVATVILFAIITYRLVFWQKYFRNYIGHNQYVILIYNLLLADLQEALGFLFSLHWVHRDALTQNTGVCFAQGWLLQIGDPASGLFVFAIAMHTFVVVVLRWKIPHWVFVGCIVGLWTFCLLLAVIPTARYGKDTYAPTGPWVRPSSYLTCDLCIPILTSSRVYVQCWLHERYEAERLWLHYFWIFFSEFGSVILYAILYLYLRRRVTSSEMLGGDPQTENLSRIRRVTGYMVLYPLAYTILSLPLAAGRMAASSGQKMGVTYFCVAGALIASSGCVDVVMYAFTRTALLSDSQLTYPVREYSMNLAYLPHSHTATVTADIKHSNRTDLTRPFYRQGGRGNSPTPGRYGSTDSIVRSMGLTAMGKVYQKTTIEVTSERIGETDSSYSDSMSDTAAAPHPQLETTWYGR